MGAQEELQQLDQAEKDLKARRGRLEQERTTATAVRGEEILAATIAGGDPGPASARLSEIEGEIAGITQALSQLEGKRQAAMRRVGYEQVERLRVEAADLEAKAADHEAVTKRLLDQLREHEGCDYAPCLERFHTQRPKGQALREEARHNRAEADRLQRELDIAPKVAAEQAAEEAKWAAIEPGRMFQAADGEGA